MKNDDKDIMIDRVLSAVGRFLCLIVAGCVVCGAVQSCSVPACAADTQTEAEEYQDAFLIELDRFEEAVNIGLAVGNLTPGVGKYAAIMQTYLLMNSYEYYQMKYYSDENNSSSSYSVPTTPGYSGVYRLSGDNSIYVCSIFTSGSSSGTIVTCPHYSITFEIPPSYASNVTVESSISSDYYGLNFSSSSYFYVTLSNSFNGSTAQRNAEYYYPLGKYTANAKFGTSSGIPTIDPARIITSYNQTVCGNGVIDSLPAGEIERSEPWDYYNNELLPELKTLAGDDSTLLDLLPWGGAQYVPGHVGPFDPTEPARPDSVDLPSNLPVVPYVPGVPTEVPVEIDTNGTTEIYEVYSPTTNQISINGVAFIFGVAGAFGAAGAAGAAGGVFANGQILIGGVPFDIPSSDLLIEGFDVPISIPDSNTIQLGDLEFHFNPDGTITIGDMTFNLPLGEPETVEVGAESYLVEYQLPTFETFYIPNETLPNVNLAEFSDGINLMWEAVYNFLYDTGFLPLVYISFGLGVVGFVLWKIGG